MLASFQFTRFYEILANFCQNISEHFVKKISKIFGKFCQKKWDSGAVQRSALCRSRRELSNAYFLAKFGFDTAENEPSKVCPMRGPSAVWWTSVPAGWTPPDGFGEETALPGREKESSAKRMISRKMHFSKMHFSKSLQIFGGLVLGCIETKFCKKICVRQHFSSSTRFASFCTAAISIF